jgi:hypothetical protein
MRRFVGRLIAEGLHHRDEIQQYSATTNTRPPPGAGLGLVVDFLTGEIVTPTAEDYAEGYVIDGECFALGQDNVLPFKRGRS